MVDRRGLPDVSISSSTNIGFTMAPQILLVNPTYFEMPTRCAARRQRSQSPPLEGLLIRLAAECAAGAIKGYVV